MASIPGSGSSSSSGFQSGFGDTTFTKVFVGGLAWETQSDTLGQYFEQFGDILEAVVITDKHTGRSKGYGFVTFRDPESAVKACVDPAPVIDGRRANCNLASLGRPRPALPFGHMASPIPYVGGVQPARVPSMGGYGYQQPLYYNYRQGVVYPSYPYGTYGQEYVSIHRAFTTRIQVSSIFRYMEQLTHRCILTIKRVKSLQVVMATRPFRVTHHQVIKLCNLVDRV